MTTAAEAALRAQTTSLFVPVDWVPLAASSDTLDRPLRAIRADTDCTITVRTAVSENEDPQTTRDMKFLAGETRYGVFTAITAISAGTAEGAV